MQYYMICIACEGKLPVPKDTKADVECMCLRKIMDGGGIRLSFIRLRL